MKQVIIATVVTLLFLATAYADSMLLLFAGSGGSGGGGGGCAGVIDLSTGCVQPMFGGL